MRSHDGQRKQPTSSEGLRQKVAVKPQGYVGAPSLSSGQIDNTSREDQGELLDRMLDRNNFGSLTSE